MPDPEGDVDLLAALWNEAPFARLPADAPQDLLEYVREVENPKRVFAIYQASRRHGFQLLVEKYVLLPLFSKSHGHLSHSLPQRHPAFASSSVFIS